jgi:hypothetical protein
LTFPVIFSPAAEVMTFLVNQQGAIYEKDLGWRTTAIALEMTSFDPDSTWRRVKGVVQIPIRIDIVSPSQGPRARD